MRPLLLAALLAAPGAAAEQWVYSAYLGGGVGVHLGPSEPARAPGSILAESVLGLTDALNLEAPLLVEVGKGYAASLGLGVEYVYFHTNHWRLDLGAGLGLRYPFEPASNLQPGAYLESSIRWLFTWGAGACISLHVWLIDAARPALIAFPSLSLYQEFW